jgi:hypothetical protein
MFAPVAKLLTIPSGDSPLPARAPEGVAPTAEAPLDMLGKPGDAVLLAAGSDGVAPVAPPEVVTVFVLDETVELVVVAVVAPMVSPLMTVVPTVLEVALVCAMAGTVTITNKRAKRQDRGMSGPSMKGLTFPTPIESPRSR